jgi:Protein of unknown function (DUF3307)
MHYAITVFLALLLGHLLADFLLQTSGMVAAKQQRGLPYLKHGFIHYLSAIVCLLIFTTQPVGSARAQVLLWTYVLLHIGLDISKRTLVKRKIFLDRAWLFLCDQALHVLTIAGLTWGLTGFVWPRLRPTPGLSSDVRLHTLVIAVVYVGVLFGGGYLIRYCTRSLSEQSVVGQESPEELRNAGLYIGWLERFLVITAVLVQSPAMIGLILTGKSIARFPELKQARFAEYFLIGTFLSISIALLGGLVLVRYLYGTTSLR